MNAGHPRLMGDHTPDEDRLSVWMGADAYAVWRTITDRSERTYPGVFAPELAKRRRPAWLESAV